MEENLDKIIQDCKANKPKAQEALYKKFSRLIFGICMRYAKSKFDAEDVFQETFIKIFQNIHQYRNEGSFEGWVRRIAVNTSLKKIQSSKIVFHQLEFDTQAEEPPLNENVLNDISVQELISMIETLPLGYKTVFNLYAVEGFSHKEIAQTLEISEGTSKSQYFHAKKLLKNLLQQKNITAHAS